MSGKTVKTARSTSVKRVSFSPSAKDEPLSTRVSPEQSSEVEIASFPYSEFKSIPRLDFSSLNSPNTHSKSSRRKSKPTNVPEVKPRVPKRTKGYKEPTETVKHALLRSMSHRAPSESALSFFEKTLGFRPPSLEPVAYQNQEITTPRSSRGSAEWSSVDPIKIRFSCGQCRRIGTILPATGFCKFCAEYLCAQCVISHRSRLTKSHPVLVFYCHVCKEMNILNGKGAGHCVRCEAFYCSVCLLKHCSETGHRILEGEDLQDIVNFMIER